MTPDPSVNSRAGRPRIAYLIKQLEAAIKAAMGDLTREHGITVLQYTALSVLERYPGMSGAQLSRRSFVTAQAGSEMVSHLTRKGMILREPSPDNRRVLKVTLTDHGRRVLRSCEEGMDILESTMLHGLAQGTVEELRTVLMESIKKVAGQRSQTLDAVTDRAEREG